MTTEFPIKGGWAAYGQKHIQGFKPNLTNVM